MLKKNDRFFVTDAEMTVEGAMDVASFFTREALTDSVLWAKFVRVFRTQPDGERLAWRGEYWGKMMRGAAMIYTCTRDPKLYATMTETVRDLLTVAEADGRVSSYSRETEFDGWDMWCRKYVLLGLQYYYDVCTDEALKCDVVRFMQGCADYVLSFIGDGEGKRTVLQTGRSWGGLNSSSILEPIVRLYAITGEERYLNFASHIVRQGGSSMANIFEMACENKLYPYQYGISKAYEMISFFEGVLDYAKVTGEEKYVKAVENFGKRVLESDITVIGCAGMTHELFDHSAARQTSSYFTGIKQETCVTVTWMKFCIRMLILTGDPKYADCFEQSLYNAYAGALNTKKHAKVPEHQVDCNLMEYGNPTPIFLPFDSYSEMRLNVRGRQIGGLQQFAADRTYYGCCACIGSAGAGLVGHMALMKAEGGIVVNLYSDCDMETKTPEGNKLGVSIGGGYPRGGEIKMSLKLKKREQFSIALRIPTWSVKTAISINGEAVDVTPGYTVIDRIWKNGDEILLSLDMRTEIYRPDTWGRDVIRNGQKVIEVRENPEDQNFFALRRGPLMLARDAQIPGNHFDPVDMLTDDDGYAVAELLEPDAVDFETVAVVKLALANDKSMTLVDFSSAGKTWDERSLHEVWMPLNSMQRIKRNVIRVTIWNEFQHEKKKPEVKALYPDGIHAFVRDFLKVNEDLEIRLAALCDPDQGLPDKVLESTDVLIWWGHVAHAQVDDALVERIRNRVYLGKMGFIALHSAHHSKPFKAIVGTNGNLSWGRNQKEIMWTMMPSHEIAAGIPDHFLLEEEELYSEPFYIPQPDALVFGAWFEDGHIMRAGACFHRGAGKVFYFQPGHETCKSFYNPYVQRVITNAVRWAAPNQIVYEIKNDCPHILKKTVDEFNQ